MEFLLIPLGFLVNIAIIGGIIALVVYAVRRNGGDEAQEEPGIGTVRRVFFYGLAFIALMLATTGISFLLSQTLDTLFEEAVLRDDASGIAFGLAATIVGLPIWLLLWRAAQRSMEEHPVERGTLARKLYVYLVLGVSAAVVAGFGVQLVRGILDPSRFDVNALSPILAWGALWLVHWQWENAEGQPSAVAQSVRRLYAYITSTYGLVLLAVGAAQLLTHLLRAAYDTMTPGSIIGGSPFWSSATQDPLALVLIGGIWWWYHWHRISARDADSLLRQVVIYVVAIFGGLVTAVAAAATILYTVLVWAFDPAGAAPLTAHFSGLPGSLAALIIGGAIWRYHSEIVLQEASTAGERILSAQRAYRYLTAAVGLGTLAVGMAFLFGLVIGLLVPGARGELTGSRWWAEPIAITLTLILVGGPLWWRYWFLQQTTALESGPDERQALPRRIFIFAVFGIAVLATLGSLSAFLVMLLQALFEGNLSTDVLDGGKWALGIVLTAGTISIYYWQVLKEDRAAAPGEPQEEEAAPAVTPPVAPPLELTALTPAAAAATARAIAARLNVPVTLWQRQDAEAPAALTEEQIAAAAEQVRASGAGRVLLLIDGAGVQVVPYSA